MIHRSKKKESWREENLPFPVSFLCLKLRCLGGPMWRYSGPLRPINAPSAQTPFNRDFPKGWMWARGLQVLPNAPLYGRSGCVVSLVEMPLTQQCPQLWHLRGAGWGVWLQPGGTAGGRFANAPEGGSSSYSQNFFCLLQNQDHKLFVLSPEQEITLLQFPNLPFKPMVHLKQSFLCMSPGCWWCAVILSPSHGSN